MEEHESPKLGVGGSIPSALARSMFTYMSPYGCEAFIVCPLRIWYGGRVVEGAELQTPFIIVGSNPTRTSNIQVMTS